MLLYLYILLPVKFSEDNTSLSENIMYGYIDVISTSGEIYPVCQAKFEDIDAQVACKELGFTTGRTFPNLLLKGGEPFTGKHNVKRSVDCRGNETTMDECISEISHYSCDTQGKAVIACFKTNQDLEDAQSK